MKTNTEEFYSTRFNTNFNVTATIISLGINQEKSTVLVNGIKDSNNKKEKENEK